MWDVHISSGISNTSQNGEKCPPSPSSLHLSERTAEITLPEWGLLHFQHSHKQPCTRLEWHQGTSQVSGEKILRVFKDWQIIIDNVYSRNDTDIVSERSIAHFHHLVRNRGWDIVWCVQSVPSSSEMTRREKFLSLLCIFIGDCEERSVHREGNNTTVTICIYILHFIWHRHCDSLYYTTLILFLSTLETVVSYSSKWELCHSHSIKSTRVFAMLL